jgi:hypothetical protein
MNASQTQGQQVSADGAVLFVNGRHSSAAVTTAEEWSIRRAVTLRILYSRALGLLCRGNVVLITQARPLKSPGAMTKWLI